MTNHEMIDDAFQLFQLEKLEACPGFPYDQTTACLCGKHRQMHVAAMLSTLTF